MSAVQKVQSKVRLGELLIKRGLVSEKTLHVALEEQRITKQRLGNVLVSNGFLSQRDLVDAIRDHDIEQLTFETTLITRCPPELLIETKTVILVEGTDAVFLATMSDEEEVEFKLRPYYPGLKFVYHSADFGSVDTYVSKLETMMNRQEGFSDKILRDALILGASDVHIEPRAKTYSIRVRRDGVREHYHEGDLAEYGRLVTNIKMRSNIDISDKQKPHDGGYQVEHNSRLVDLRVATLPTIHGEKITIRLLDPDSTRPSLDGLGITEVHKWRMGVSSNSGLCLICGPTGSGKTTTFNATTRGMDRFGQAINTLEDPVEYVIPHISQSNVNPAVGFTFAQGVRALLRNDMDVGIVGEIRDFETAQQAVRAAETGHLILGTLHTDSISSAFDRLRDIGIDPKDIRQIIRAIMVQRLVRTICNICHGDGCHNCNHSGYRGREVVSEVEYFRDEKEVDRAISGKQWWNPMVSDAVGKVEKGVTTPLEIVRVFGEDGRRELLDRGLDAPELEF